MAIKSTGQLTTTGQFKIRQPIPPLVTSGLVAYLDASNPASYSGTGTTWSDLSGNNNHFTLSGGYTYSASGYISFDGIDAYATRANLMNLGIPQENFTIEIKFRYLSGDADQHIITNERETDIGLGDGYLIKNGRYGVDSYNTPPYEYFANGPNPPLLAVNTWSHRSISVNVPPSGGTMSSRYNVDSVTYEGTDSILTTPANTLNFDNVDIGRRRNWNYGTTYAKVDIEYVRLYNRRLTQEEQYQNWHHSNG